jgi:hypothetical protein
MRRSGQVARGQDLDPARLKLSNNLKGRKQTHDIRSVQARSHMAMHSVAGRSGRGAPEWPNSPTALAAEEIMNAQLVVW